jgi:hypothetical protein
MPPSLPVPIEEHPAGVRPRPGVDRVEPEIASERRHRRLRVAIVSGDEQHSCLVQRFFTPLRSRRNRCVRAPDVSMGYARDR